MSTLDKAVAQYQATLYQADQQAAVQYLVTRRCASCSNEMDIYLPLGRIVSPEEEECGECGLGETQPY